MQGRGRGVRWRGRIRHMSRSTNWAAIAALAAALATPPGAHAAEFTGTGRLGVATWPADAYAIAFDVPVGPLLLRGDVGSMYRTLGWGAGVEWPFAIPTGSLGPVVAAMQAPAPHACPD